MGAVSVDRMETLAWLMERKRKPSLECTVDVKCWCMKLDLAMQMSVGVTCMSPAELLENEKSDLSQKDIDYLTSLLDREFIPQ